MARIFAVHGKRWLTYTVDLDDQLEVLVNERPQRDACRVCDARLASDNRAAVCGPCARRKSGEAGTAPAVPDAFWNQPEICNPLMERNFGKFLRAYREAHREEITQTDVAGWLGLTQGQVSRLERAAKPVQDLGKLDRWARALRIPQRCLWFTLSPQPSDAYISGSRGASLRSAANTEGDDLHRRQFLKATSAGVATVGTSLLQGIMLTAAPASARTGIPQVDILQEVTQTFRRVDNRYGGGHSRSALTSYLASSVEPLLQDGRAVGRTRDELFAGAAEMHQLAGWMSYDTGQTAAGRHHMRRALRLCQEAGDDALAGEMLAGMSHHAAFHGSPAAAVDLALAARQAAKRCGLPALRAEAAVMEAHGLALQADKTGCLHALNEAEQVFTAVDHAQTPPWLSYFDDAYLAAKFAHAFRDLGMPREAEKFARRSLEMHEGYERGRLFNTALLAATLADQSRIDEACAAATTAVHMTGTVRSVRSVAYLADVGRRLSPFRDNAEVQTLYRRMAAVGLPIR